MPASNTASVTQPCVPSRPPSSLIYFAFGSNLSSTQMLQRCPRARGMSLGRLRNWSFFINQRGYANIIPAATATGAATTSSIPDVYGVLYQLHSAEEKASLDRYEGVPTAYEDLLLPVEVLDREERVVGVVWAICYVDGQRTAVGEPREEYVGRMNRGIKEASAEWGLPSAYVRREMRLFIPPEGRRTRAGSEERRS